jgi:hypothetical protein
MKQLKEDGTFHVISLDAAGKTGDEVLRDHYLADNYADATEEEFNAQEASVEDSVVEGDVPSEEGEVSPEAESEEVAT